MKDQNIYDYTLLLADSSLIMGQRLSEWTGHGPMLEQDIAITNITLDLIGQSRHLYQFAAEIKNGEGNGSTPATEDTIAYLRDAHEYKNLLITELPNKDWAQTILKIFFYAYWQQLIYSKLIYSPYKQLAAVAGKALKEVAYHIRWSTDWVKRLGDGTDESHNKMEEAVTYLWPYTGEMFVPANYEWDAFEKINEMFFDHIKEEWLENVFAVLQEATLTIPDAHAYMHRGGKTGIHTENLGYILAEMQFLQRTYPGCEW